MPRTINHEALLSPVLETQTRFGVRPAVEVLVRDLTGGQPVRCARYVQAKSTDVETWRMRERLQAALRAAYGASNVTTFTNRTQWPRTFRFVFDHGDPETVLDVADLPFIDAEDLAG